MSKTKTRATTEVQAGTGPFRLIARANHPRLRDGFCARAVRVGPVEVGGERPAVIAGPCAVESRSQTLEIAHACKAAGADMLRGGAYKPRTSPYDFQGLGVEGLEVLAEARAQTGLPVVSEVLDVRLVDEVAAHVDCLQVGARNMYNAPLLREVGRAGKPVLLKRHWTATLKEWLCAAEYGAGEGNLDIILCARGIRSVPQGDYNRSTHDVQVVGPVRERTVLPIIVDPSHGTGVPALVPGAALAGICAGAHGLIIEVIGENTDPDEPFCDGFQSIRPSMLESVIDDVRAWSARRTPMALGPCYD